MPVSPATISLPIIYNRIAERARHQIDCYWEGSQAKIVLSRVSPKVLTQTGTNVLHAPLGEPASQDALAGMGMRHPTA